MSVLPKYSRGDRVLVTSPTGQWPATVMETRHPSGRIIVELDHGNPIPVWSAHLEPLPEQYEVQPFSERTQNLVGLGALVTIVVLVGLALIWGAR